MATEILDYQWYSGLATIGIVKTKDQLTGEIKFRIGKALDNGGTEEEDAKYIANHGSKIDVPELVKYLTGE